MAIYFTGYFLKHSESGLSIRTPISSYSRFIAAIAQHNSFLFSLVFLFFAAHLFSLGDCWSCDVGKWLDIPAQVAHADAIVVLGGDTGRLPTAATLFHNGIAPELWYTGATGESQASNGNSAVALHIAQELGIPAGTITLLATTSTWEDGEQIAATAQERGIDSILVVTSWYHGRRALCSIHHHLQDDSIQVYYQPVPTFGFGPEDWWQSRPGQRAVTSELYKILFYWANYGLIPWSC